MREVEGGYEVVIELEGVHSAWRRVGEDSVKPRSQVAPDLRAPLAPAAAGMQDISLESSETTLRLAAGRCARGWGGSRLCAPLT